MVTYMVLQRGQKVYIFCLLNDSIFSGIKTARDVYNCMVKNDCEKVTEYGYGYTDVTEKSCHINAPCQNCSCPPTEASNSMWVAANEN